MMATDFGTLREILSEWGDLNWVMATDSGTAKGMMVTELGTLNRTMATASGDFHLMMARKASLLV